MNRNVKKIIFMFPLLLFGCKHTSPPVDEGVMTLAEQGDAASQMKVALAFDREEDFAEAALWYRKAAEQGVSQAQNNLGVMYKDGQGVRQDFSEAARWFQMAAQQNNTLAQLNLGILYLQQKDTTTAIHWLQQASQQGNSGAQRILQHLIKRP